MNRLLILVTSLIFFLTACQTADRKSGILLYDDQSPANQSLLIDTVSKMLNVTNVTLANDAFSSSSEIIVEQHKLPGSGRDLSKPNHFKLWVQGESCILEHVESGKFETIADLQCVEASN